MPRLVVPFEADLLGVGFSDCEFIKLKFTSCGIGNGILIAHSNMFEWDHQRRGIKILFIGNILLILCTPPKVYGAVG